MSREERIEAHRRKVETGAAERVAKHDRLFAEEYVDAGGDLAVSLSLAKQFGHTDDELARMARGASRTHAYAREEGDEAA